MKDVTTTGYDEGTADSKPETITYELLQENRSYGPRRAFVLLRNGVASGIIYLDHEAEGPWLQERINGTLSL